MDRLKTRVENRAAVEEDHEHEVASLKAEIQQAKDAQSREVVASLKVMSEAHEVKNEQSQAVVASLKAELQQVKIKLERAEQDLLEDREKPVYPSDTEATKSSVDGITTPVHGALDEPFQTCSCPSGHASQWRPGKAPEKCPCDQCGLALSLVTPSDAASEGDIPVRPVEALVAEGRILQS